MQAGRPLLSWESLLCDLAQGGHPTEPHRTTPEQTRVTGSAATAKLLLTNHCLLSLSFLQSQAIWVFRRRGGTYQGSV